MATLPPRKNSTTRKIFKQRLTPLQTLLQLGFPKHRAEKALAATGHRSVQLASDWLLAHVGDPTLDSCTARQYVLYACPTGPLAERLLTFWGESQTLGWNGAHNLIPHITLVSFFEAADESAKDIVAALDNVASGTEERVECLNLETYVSPNFMGLFVKDEHAKWLKGLAVRYVDELRKLRIAAEPQAKSLHLTLAYQFNSSLFPRLRTMVERLGANAPANWELRLYSRDCRLQNCQVRKVINAHVPREHDELELRVGDYVYIEDGAGDASVDGWVEGVSWLTGTSGHLPLNHTERSAESDSWTLHTALRITHDESDALRVDDVPMSRSLPVAAAAAAATPPAPAPPPPPPPALRSVDDSTDAPDGVATSDEPIEARRPSSALSREIFICRHGERVDFTFGAWIPYCFETNGAYVRRDLNMPKSIPSRNIQDFQNDGPLTTVGEVQASLVGEAMKLSSVKIDVAFTSPSLRCVQTLAHILKGLGTDIPMKVEPGLIEWLAWYPHGVPIWMTTQELVNAGFNVDRTYAPHVQPDELPLKENTAQYYERSYDLMKRIIERTAGNVLIVAHAASLAACTRQLTGGRVPAASEVTRLVQRVPYLACLAAREGLDGWKIHPPPFPPITHTSNNRFDWKVLM